MEISFFVCYRYVQYHVAVYQFKQKANPGHFSLQGTLRVLLVLLHDFPEFLCDFHYAFCDVIPPNCIQMRNLILSAFPRNMRLPDPFTPNLKVDMLQDIAQPPRILTSFVSMIQPPSFRKVNTAGPMYKDALHSLGLHSFQSPLQSPLYFGEFSEIMYLELASEVTQANHF